MSPNTVLAIVIARTAICSVVAVSSVAILLWLVTRGRERQASRTALFSLVVVVALGLVFAFAGKVTLSKDAFSADSGSFRDYVAALQSERGDPVRVQDLNARNPEVAAQYLDLLQNRIEIRSRLRAIYDLSTTSNLASGTDVSISNLAATLEAESVLRPDMAGQIKRFADATHFSEWRDVPLPEDSELDFARANGPALIYALDDKEKELRKSKYASAQSPTSNPASRKTTP
jgi:hypothetical protein